MKPLANVVNVSKSNVVNVRDINACLLRGDIDRAGVLPHLDSLSRSEFTFQVDFGLSSFPEGPGVLLIRGPRQYGKSTWLEGEIRRTIREHGPGSAWLAARRFLGNGLQGTRPFRRRLPRPVGHSRQFGADPATR